MFDSLNDRLTSIFKNLKGHGKLSEANIKDVLREIRLALLEADVNFRVVKNFVATLEKRAIGQEVLSSITPGQQVVKIVHDSLVEVMGGKAAPFELQQSKINAILLLGLQGS